MFTIHPSSHSTPELTQPTGHQSFKTKMRLHAPGLELPHAGEADVFFMQCLTSESFLLCPAWLHCREMQGHLMEPQPLLSSHCPTSAGRRRGFVSLQQNWLWKRTVKKCNFFSLGKKKKNLSLIRSFMFLIAKNKYRERSNRAISA